MFGKSLSKKANSGLMKVLTLVLIGGVAVIPVINGINTSGWSATNVTLFGLITTFVIIGLIRKAAK
jgi:hypothetical protein